MNHERVSEESKKLKKKLGKKMGPIRPWSFRQLSLTGDHRGESKISGSSVRNDTDYLKVGRINVDTEDIHELLKMCQKK